MSLLFRLGAADVNRSVSAQAGETVQVVIVVTHQVLPYKGALEEKANGPVKSTLSIF